MKFKLFFFTLFIINYSLATKETPREKWTFFSKLRTACGVNLLSNWFQLGNLAKKPEPCKKCKAEKQEFTRSDFLAGRIFYFNHQNMVYGLRYKKNPEKIIITKHVRFHKRKVS